MLLAAAALAAILVFVFYTRSTKRGGGGGELTADTTPAIEAWVRSALEQELAELRQKKVSGQLDKPHQFRAARKQIAQLLTIENEGKKK